MNKKMSWSKQHVLTFINMYRSSPSLWRVKSKEYSNKLLKETQYEKLAAFCRTIDPEATRDTVVTKVNNLRGSFRKEWKKQEKSLQLGEDVYEPKLWYFNDLLFLLDQEEAKEDTHSNHSVDQDEWPDHTSMPASPHEDVKDTIISLDMVSHDAEEESADDYSEPEQEDNPEPATVTTTTATTRYPPVKTGTHHYHPPHHHLNPNTTTTDRIVLGKKRKLHYASSGASTSSDSAGNNNNNINVHNNDNKLFCSNGAAMDIVDVASQNQNPSQSDPLPPPPPPPPPHPSSSPCSAPVVVSTEDQFDVYGRHIAFKMRGLSREQKIHAEKYISDVLYDAELGLLSRHRQSSPLGITCTGTATGQSGQT